MTEQQYKDEYIKALRKEIDLNASFLRKEPIKTIYFGGGTPSTLTIDELKSIIDDLKKHLSFDTLEELTLEVNPDDVSQQYIQGLVQLGVNRLSMGIQSFFDAHLRKMNRRHNAQQAREAIEIAKINGIENMSIDLIYGLPYMSFEEWQQNVQMAIDSNVQHISAYHLTFEKGTLYYDYLKKGQLKEVEEEFSVQQFEYLVKELTKAGFDNYEISNFALPGYTSRHNSNYWTGDTYFGFGPSAHAFDGNHRKWNVRDVRKYCTLITEGKQYYELEELSSADRYNELIMLGLRTKQGFELSKLEIFLTDSIRQEFDKELQHQLKLGNVIIDDGFCKVNDTSQFITDRIISEFFYVGDE